MQITNHDCSINGCCSHTASSHISTNSHISKNSQMIKMLQKASNSSLQLMIDSCRSICQLADKHPRMVITATAITVGVMAISGVLPLELVLITASTATVTSIGSLINHQQ